jgi:hypothetical protein
MICLKSQLNLKCIRLHTSTSICTYIYVSWFHGQIADADRVIVFSLASQWHTRNYASGNTTSIRSLYVNPASTAIESKKTAVLLAAVQLYSSQTGALVLVHRQRRQVAIDSNLASPRRLQISWFAPDWIRTRRRPWGIPMAPTMFVSFGFCEIAVVASSSSEILRLVGDASCYRRIHMMVIVVAAAFWVEKPTIDRFRWW